MEETIISFIISIEEMIISFVISIEELITSFIISMEEMIISFIISMEEMIIRRKIISDFLWQSYLRLKGRDRHQSIGENWFYFHFTHVVRKR